VRSAIPEGEWRLIREALQRGQLTGSARFTDQVEAWFAAGSSTADAAGRKRGGGQTRGRNKSVPFFTRVVSGDEHVGLAGRVMDIRQAGYLR
jgi:hypothetical protein